MTFLTNTHQTCRPARPRKISFMDLMALYHQRRALAGLDDDTLEDLGLTRREAAIESRRPLWDIPANWQ